MSRIDDEIDFHLDMLTRELIDAGMPPEAARVEAQRRFGDRNAVRRSVMASGVNTLLTMLALVAVASSYRLLSFLPSFRWLHAHEPYYVAESLKNVLEVSLCVAALLLMRRRRIVRELAIDGRVLPALAFGVAAAWPMLIGFAIANRSDVTDWISVAYLAFFSPFVEELVTRGFAFRALRRSGWPLWPAAVACAMITGIAHIEKGQTAAQILGIFAVSGIGGLTFSWLIERWQSIWFPFALHALMDFSWELFNVAPTVLGGWYAFVLQSASVLLAILITLRFTRTRDSQPVGEDRLGDRRELHVRRSLVDLSDLRVAPVLLDRVLLRVAVAAEELDGERGHLLADLR